MSATWKTVRVFISSTFRDMHAERDYLVRFVFPRLREELLRRHIHFVDVDLRWGVTSDRDALEVCREVVDECRPRFVCLLGGRYGDVKPGHELSVTHEEVKYGVLDRLGEHGYVFFYFRDPAATDSIIEKQSGEFREPAGSMNQAKLDTFKSQIWDAGLKPVVYPARWDTAQRRLTGLITLGNQIYSDLLDSVTTDPELRDRFVSEMAQPSDEFSEEDAAMEAFIEERTERYVIGSREPLLREMIAFATSADPPSLFVVLGDPGSGKSALLAKFARELTSNLSPFHSQPFIVLSHFIGASAGSTDLRSTLRRLCHELAQAADRSESLPLDVEKLITHFQKLLIEVAAKRRVILLFDALNQFNATDGAHYLRWLPLELPPGARILASTVDHPDLRLLESRGDTVHLVKLPPISETDALAIIQGYLQRYAKHLTPEQLAALLAKPGSRLPLYILTALEELRTLGTYEEITTRIGELPGEARALFGWILEERLSRDPGFRDCDGRPCGVVLVGKFAACLGASRHGLSPTELTALVDPGDPLGNVAALLRLLRPYLMWRGELIDFYHAQFREAAEHAYLNSSEKVRVAHSAIAACLRTLADPDGDGHCRDPSSHALSELAYHQTRAEAWSELVATLENIFFLEAKVTRGMAFDLAQDLTTAVKALPKEQAGWQRMCLLDEALRRDIHFIASHAYDYPQALFQCLWNSAWWYDCPELTKHYGSDGKLEELDPSVSWDKNDINFHKLLEKWRKQKEIAHKGFTWLRSVRPPQMSIGGPQRAVFWGHQKVINCLSLASDGRRLASGSDDGLIRVWDAENGNQLFCLRGHPKYIEAVAFSPIGDRIVSGGGRYDRSVRVWDAQTGIQLLCLDGHTKRVTDVGFSFDGQLLVSTSEDASVRIWDAGTGSHKVTLPGHQERAAFVPGRDWLISSGAGTASDQDVSINLWDAKTGCQVRCLLNDPDFNRVVDLKVSDDGGKFAVAGCGGGIRIYDLMDSRMTAHIDFGRVLRGGLNFSHDGSKLAFACHDDGSIHIWDTSSTAELAVFRGHKGQVIGGDNKSSFRAVFSPDDEWVYSTGDDTIRKWRTKAQKTQPVLSNHDHFIKGIRFSRDGAEIVTTSGGQTLRIWSSRSGQILLNNRIGEEGGHRDNALFSPDGQHIYCPVGGTLRAWDARSGHWLGDFEGAVDQVYSTRIALSADGSVALSWGMVGHFVNVWDVRQRRLRFRCGWRGGGVDTEENVAISDDGTLLAFDSSFFPRADGLLETYKDDPHRIKVVKTSDGCQVVEFRGLTNKVRSLCFSSDATMLLSGSPDGTVRLWDLHRGIEQLCLHGPRGTNRVALSKDGRTIVSSGGRFEQVTRSWDVPTGCLLRSINGVGDPGPVAAGSRSYPVSAFIRGIETSIVSQDDARPIASLPVKLDFLQASPDGRTWAGAMGNHLLVFTLEGH